MIVIETRRTEFKIEIKLLIEESAFEIRFFLR
jgi:hypothetical protein